MLDTLDILSHILCFSSISSLKTTIIERKLGKKISKKIWDWKEREIAEMLYLTFILSQGIRDFTYQVL